MTNSVLTVLEQGRSLSFTFEDLLTYHGGGFPGGVANGFKVMERALPLLSDDRPPERREILVRTAFRGPGARDAFEMVTRGVTEDRYVVDPVLERPDRGMTLERYVFRLSYRDRTVNLLICDGVVRDEFVALSRKEERTAEEDAHLETLKQDMADRLLARSAEQAYDVVEQS